MSKIALSTRLNNYNKLFDNQSSNHKRYMDSKEAADYLRISTGALRNKVWRREVIAYKQGRKLLFLKSDLDLIVTPIEEVSYD